MSKDNEFADAVEAGSNTGDAWEPKEKDVLIGTYKKLRENVGPNNSNMYIIQEDGKEDTTGVWGSTVIDGKFEEIPVGSRVQITYLGKVKSPKGRGEYKDYKVLYKPVDQNVADAFPGSEAA